MAEHSREAEPTLFSSVYAGSVGFYARMLKAGTVCFDTEARVNHHDKSHNRCRIAGAGGVLTLTVPIEKPASWRGFMVRDMRISEHGDWRRIHRGALFSAYGKTPFFEYIAPELYAIFERGDRWLIDFNLAIHNLVVDFLDLPITSVPKPALLSGSPEAVIDRHNAQANVEYYQIRAQKYGFIPDLSILDLLMNTGREAIFTLNALNAL